MNINATQLLEATTFSSSYTVGDDLFTKNVVAHPSDSLNVFYVGTCAPKQQNKVNIVEYVEEKNKIIERKSLKSENPVQKIFPSKVKGKENQFYCIFELQNGTKVENSIQLCDSNVNLASQVQEEGEQQQKSEVEELRVLNSIPVNSDNIYHSVVQPYEQENQIYVCDQKQLMGYDLQAQKFTDLVKENTQEVNNVLTIGDPHHSNLLVSIDDLNDINVVDTREQKSKFVINEAHNLEILDVDFNPNKQYYFQTCSMDNLVKFWDLRKTNLAIKCIDDFNNMPLNSKYNRLHDQLYITSFNDGSVQLNKAASISSMPFESSMQQPGAANDDDGLVKVYDEHEDSAYSIAWSNASAWVFASVSIHGHLIVNSVPSSEKYRLLY